MLVADFPGETIEETQVRNVMRNVKGSGAPTTGQCRRLLERLLEEQHLKDPDLVVIQLLDDEDRLKGVLWVTGEQRRAWIACGSDILIHDNTYNLDQLGYKLGVFSAICKEGRTIPVGQCFIIDEESDSYAWQLRMWFEAHDNIAPLVIITDADPAVVAVVADVFPHAYHIWCLYHLIANIFKNCRSAVGGAIGQLVVDFITTSKTQTEVAFRARWALLLARYPSAESYLKKQLGANFPRWGAPWLQCFSASSFASSRGEGANKDYKHGVLLRTLTLEEAFDRVREVQARKAKKTEIREIRAGTSRVDADKLCKQWFPDITDKLAEHISGYATQLCHEEMGSSGNYRVVACHEAAAVPDGEDLEGEVTLHPVAEVPQVDPGTLNLRRFTEHLDRADLAEKDPFRRAGLASFLASRPDGDTCKVVQVENSLHRVSQYIVFYDPVRVQCNREGDNVTVFKSHWCTCGMCITAGLPCRHFYAAHRDLAWAGFHLHLINTRWHKTQLESSLLWTYGTNATRVSATVAAPLSAKTTDTSNKKRRKSSSPVVRIEDGIRKRKALEAAAPADRALMAKIQAVANVQDYNRPDNKAKGRRKCSKCGSAGHNRATCPKREPAQENLPPSGPTTGHGAPATSAAAGAAP
eukprot:jgi/Tetstr1/434526/TSEL_023618.t1